MLQPTLYELLQILCYRKFIHMQCIFSSLLRVWSMSIENGQIRLVPLSVKIVPTQLLLTLAVSTSTKRPRPLRCKIVNDMLHCAAAAPFAALPNHDIQILVKDTNNGVSCPSQHDTIALLPSFMFSTDKKWIVSLF